MLRSSEPWERDSTARLAGISVGNDPAGDRTQDLRIKSPLLYQLSYRVERTKPRPGTPLRQARYARPGPALFRKYAAPRRRSTSPQKRRGHRSNVGGADEPGR